MFYIKHYIVSVQLWGLRKQGIKQITKEQFNAVLRTSWTAEQIGHLLIRYESEWYADEGLSKWNEVDELFEEEKQQQKALIEAGLDELGITEPYLRDFALDVVDEAHKHVKSNWQLEKAQRIKPSLWWKKVAEAQTAISNQTPVNANTQILSNLSMDGKAWFIHPVGISILRENKIDYCSIKFHRISKIVLRHEGGYVNNPNDSGGATNRGIAWNTWVAYAKQDLGIDPTLDNLKKLTDEQAEIIYRKRYWQPKGFCRIESDRLGLMIYDWSITSGGAIKKIQQLLVNEFNQNLNIDGKMGEETALIINSLSEQDKLLTRITEIRKEYYTNLAIKKDGTHTKNYVFLKGWLNRVDDCLTVKIDED